MSKYFCFTGLLLLLISSAFAQPIKIFGKITNTLLEPLPYASIQIKEEQIGKNADSKGFYEFTLKQGKYDLVVSLVGYKTQTVTVVLENTTVEKNILLEPSDQSQLHEIKISTNKKDRAAEIIRHVIEHKDSFSFPSKSYSVSLYIKAQQAFEANKKDSIKRAKKIAASDSLHRKHENIEGKSLVEVATQLDWAYPNKLKETRTGVKKYGSTEKLFYLTATDGDFNFYKNLVDARSLSNIPFLSPFSYSGLLAYRFKLLKSYDENGMHYFKIKITGVKLGNALMNGEVIIADSFWVIKKISLEFPGYHLPNYDYFKVEQNFALQQKKWLLQKQIFTYHSKTNDGKVAGSTTVNYSDYQLDKIFPKKYFGVEIGSTADSAYKQDSFFWNKIRTEPLSKNEVKFIRLKDSIYDLTHSNKYLDSIDKATNRITFGRIIWDGMTLNNHYKERTIEIGPLLSMSKYILFIGGMRLGDEVSYQKRFPNKKFINITTDLSYGFLNKDIKGTVYFNKMYNPYHRSFYSIEVGHDFDLINQNDAYINLLQRGNFYQSNKLSVSHSTELFNGFYLKNDIQIAMRSDVGDYKFANTLNKLGYADSAINKDLTNQTVRTFKPYNSLYNSVEFSYVPFQKYLREPLQKIILGSQYPTIYLQWRKGVPSLFNSVENFDYIEYGLRQKRTLGMAGLFSFNFSSGKFFNTNNLQLVDNKFMRRGDPVLFSNPLRNFQALDSTFAVFNWFFELHVLHEFNGSILSKIPLVKELGLLEVAGGGMLYAPERNLKYIEAFVGVEKIIRIASNKYKIGFYWVGSAANNFQHPIQFKIGFEPYNIIKHSW